MADEPTPEDLAKEAAAEAFAAAMPPPGPKFAARITDLHICPMVTGIVPHVGGPVALGAKKTIICGLFAARVGDMVTCVGPPDAIAMGSTGVMIEGMPAARLLDQTVHGGVITLAAPTVIIGDIGGFGGVLAAASIKPTDAQIQEIQTALDEGRQQDAIDLAIEYYGIDVSNVPNGVQYDATESAYGVTDFQGNVNLGPEAVASPEVLASTIVHETTHSNQAAALRANDPTLTAWPNSTVDFDEAMAYQSEQNSAHNTGLNNNAPEMGVANTRQANHYNNLSPAEQTQYNQGNYPP